MRKIAPLLIAAFCAILALIGLGWGFSEQQKVAAQAFQERKLAFAEAENERLRSVVAEQQKAREQSENLAQRAQIEKAVANIRQLNFSHPVTYDVVTRAGIQKILEQKLADQFSDDEIKNAGIGLVALGLLPRDYPLKQKYIELLGEQIAAFYDQHQHKLFMFADASLASAQNRIILAHELTHALQDQHFGLLKMPLEIKNNDDRAFAASALIEGDATLVMSQYMLQNISLSGLRDNLGAAVTQNMKQLQDAPRYLREMLVFPYLRGQEFCATIFARDGWEALDAVYKNPPSSTSQILHPEKFLAETHEESVAIDFGDTSVNGEKPLADNVLGEMGTRILLSQTIDAKGAELIAANWCGDRYLVFNNGNALIWKSHWSDADAAQKFRGALMAAMQARFKNETQPFFEATILPDPNEVVFISAAADKWANALRQKFAR